MSFSVEQRLNLAQGKIQRARVRPGGFVYLLCFLILLSVTLAAPISELPDLAGLTERENCSVAATDRLVFDVDMTTFLSHSEAKNPLCDWTTDYCTGASDKPMGFDFSFSCQRHDFAYRNFQRQGRFISAAREKIDGVFLGDMTNVCNARFWFKRVECKKLAYAYHTAVRECRDGSCIAKVE